VHGLRTEYQDRVNFVILNYDIGPELDLVRELEIPSHPAFTIVPPNGALGDHINHIFGPMNEVKLRELLDDALANCASAR
jgi:hypothetical protein